MERRALLAAVLCLLVLLVYQEAIRRLYPPPPAPPEVPEAVASPPAEAAAESHLAPAETPRTESAPRGERVIAIDTDLYAARLTTAGGRIVSFRLKHYRTSIEQSSEPLEMIQVSGAAPPPLGARFLTDGKVEDDTTTLYAADRDALTLAGDDAGVVTLTGTLPSGARIEKTLAFKGDAYPVTVTLRSDLPANFSRAGLGWRQHAPHAPSKDPDARYRGAVVLVDKKVVHELATAMPPGSQNRFDAAVGWAGFADHYFLAAIAPDQPAQAGAVISADDDAVQILVTAPRPAPDASNRFVLYVGPKDVAVLEAADYQLSRAVDFGWFAVLAVPLLKLLKLFHSATRNYGIDIILLTVLVKVLFLPLSHKSMKSMRDMQRLQPQMAKLREKFKDDRERLNKEMIELYRRHRVNPLGGCLPMLLQFPVFIGLYQALNQSIELRHAKFAFWVRDLSTYECYPWPGQAAAAGCNDFTVLGLPIPVLVILMGASMILQQWLSPSTGMDPAQQRMMMLLMPIMFSVMFVSFPSGLVLYWLVNNLLTIGQQWWTNRATA